MWYKNFGKRIIDIVVSGLALLMLSPIFLIVAVLIRMKLGSPIFFRQERPGKNENPFLLIKFRTMLDINDSNGMPLPDGQRLTRFGHFLRATSLDELPELWNILCGDMSLVGPRPLLMRYLDRYTSEQRRRHLVKPGLTGWAQVNGRNAITWEEKFQLDVWYVENISLWLDLRILWLTVWKVIRQEGIRQTGEATMSEFMGTSAQAEMTHDYIDTISDHRPYA